MKLPSLNRFATDTLGHTNVCVNAPARNRWVVLAVLFLARTTMGFQFQSVATLTPSLISKLSIDYTQLGLLSEFICSQVLSSPILEVCLASVSAISGLQYWRWR